MTGDCLRKLPFTLTIRCFEIWDRGTFESHRQELEETIDEEMLHELLI